MVAALGKNEGTVRISVFALTRATKTSNMASDDISLDDIWKPYLLPNPYFWFS